MFKINSEDTMTKWSDIDRTNFSFFIFEYVSDINMVILLLTVNK